MNITTPAFLFSAISLLMGAYIARFSKLAILIRGFLRKEKTEFNLKQMNILKKRLVYVKYIQLFSGLSLFTATLSMILIMLKLIYLTKIIFSLSLIMFMISLILALIELYFSTTALELNLKE